jgi:putative membrane protein
MFNILTNIVKTVLLSFPAEFSCWSGFSQGMMGGMWGFGVFGMIFVVLFWGMLIFLVVWGILRLTGGQKPSPLESHDSPLEILKKRLASGEVTDEEYEKIRKKISKD